MESVSVKLFCRKAITESGVIKKYLYFTNSIVASKIKMYQIIDDKNYVMFLQTYYPATKHDFTSIQ